MRFFVDTEFIDDGKTIDLLSIGIVAEDGREYYAINRDCDFSKASSWVRDNVISKLPANNVNPQTASPSEVEGVLFWKSKFAISTEVAKFLGCAGTPTVTIDNRPYLRFSRWLGFPGVGVKWTYKWECVDAKPELWAYYADYDWVAFCQLFGTMMDLPTGFPMYCLDIKQECDRLGNPKLPTQGKGEHNALDDARHNRTMFEFLAKLDQEKHSNSK